MYGLKNFDSVNDARLELFMKRHEPKETEFPISHVKKMDGSTLPPCSKVIIEKVKRTNYICSIWKNATHAHPPPYVPDNSGWTFDNGCFCLNWFVVDASPRNIDIILSQEDDNINNSYAEDDESEYGRDSELENSDVD